MKISKVLQEKAIIDEWNVDEELRALNNKISIMKKHMDMIDIGQLQNEIDQVDNTLSDMVHDMNALQASIQHTKDKASDLMQALSPEPLAESYEMYEERKNWFNKEKLAELKQHDQFEDNEEFKFRFNTFLNKFASWKYPTIYVRPNSTHFFDALKASDTVFVLEQADITDWLKENTEENFYQKSIRFKQFHENGETFIQHMFPPEQMGLIVMENFMTFKPLEIIKQYLNECMELLRPGGYLIFTYNNCDLPSGARNYEMGAYCFTPGRMLRLICEATGYEIVDDTVSDRISWFALRKPGELSTLKGGKCLGQIMTD